MVESKLNPAIFDLQVDNHQLIKVAYDAYLANSRSSHAKTLKRGEVRGGGKKPWKQKGTGRARFGSTRNPIWRHGGVAFGRTGEENFAKKLSRTSKHTAIAQALSLKNQAKAIIVADLIYTGKVKDTVKSLTTHHISKEATLVVVDEKTNESVRGTNNIANLKLVRANYLNVFDIMNADRIIISPKALTVIDQWLGKENA